MLGNPFFTMTLVITSSASLHKTYDLHKRIEDLCDLMNHRVDSICYRLDRMDRRLDRMENRFDRIEVRLERIESKLDAGGQ